MSDFLKTVVALAIGPLGGLAGTTLGWLMAFLISGPIAAHRYVEGLQSYRLTGLRGLELLYFIAGFSIGMTAGALVMMRWLELQKNKD